MEGNIEKEVTRPQLLKRLYRKKENSNWNPPFDQSTINYFAASSIKSEGKDSDESCSSIETHLHEYETLSSGRSVEYSEINLSWSDIEIPGTWGTHGVETYPWSDWSKPVIKVKDIEELKLTEMEKLGVLSDRMIGCCSSYLDSCPVTGEYTLCKCQLISLNLKNVEILKFHHYLQYLDLSNNNITDLNCLSQLPYLMYLDVTNNALTKLLDFKPPFNLTYVNYSRNLVEDIGDLTPFWSIVYLDISHNDILIMEGLENLKYLRYLNLSYNRVECVEGLDNLPIQTLLLRSNNIYDFVENKEKGFKTNTHLAYVVLSNNKLKSLQIFREALSIEEIDMSSNSVDNLYELCHLRSLTYLIKIDFTNNPITRLQEYYDVCLFFIWSLCVLDGNLITSSEKVQARAKFNEYHDFNLAKGNMRLKMIQYLNNPCFDTAIVPVHQPPPPAIVVVGPPASRKGVLVRYFCRKHKKHAKLGVSHTTRIKWDDEIDGEAYHFVTHDRFNRLIKNGVFVTVSEFLGNCYGFAHRELLKVTEEKGVIVFHTDLLTALILRTKSLKARFVLAMPSTEEIHEDWLRQKYNYSRYNPVQSCGLLIENRPRTDDDVEREAQMIKEKTENEFKLRQKLLERSDSRLSETEETIEDDKPQEEFFMNVERDEVMRQSVMVHEFMDRDEPREVPPKASILKTACNKPSKMPKIRSTKIEPTLYNIQSVRSVTFRIQTNPSVEDPYPTESAERSASQYSYVGDSISKAALRFSGENLGYLSVLSDATLPAATHEEATKRQEMLEAEEEKKIKPISQTLSDIFYKEILRSREDYLKAHHENPGFFCEMIQTDNIDDSIKKLKEVLKECVQQQPLAKPIYEVKKDAVYTNMVSVRLKEMLSEIKGVIGVKPMERIEMHRLEDNNKERPPEIVTKMEGMNSMSNTAKATADDDSFTSQNSSILRRKSFK